MKFDGKKPPIHLIPPECIIAIAEVLEMGMAKYGENNWRKDLQHTTWSRTYSSIMRHMLAWFMGEDKDPESGLSHLAHAMTQLMILFIQQKFAPKMDDRWKNGIAPPEELAGDDIRPETRAKAHEAGMGVREFLREEDMLLHFGHFSLTGDIPL